MNREATINWLYFEIGKQPESFKLTYSFIKDGDHVFSKHTEFLELLEEDNFWRLKKVNHRSILKNELVLDIDVDTRDEADKAMKEITNRLIHEFDVPFRCFFTGSRGYHIHMYKNSWLHCRRGERELEKRAIINILKCDGMKASDKTMIALEETPHWKTGNKKTLVLTHGHWE